MATSANPRRRPVTTPKPRGVNVRAFIEQVEKGAKPLPDFFSVGKKQQNSPKFGKGSLNKPPVLTKKPTLKQGSWRSPAVVIVSSSCRNTKTQPTEANNEEEDPVSSDVNCPSEDSGHHSTWDLKYSGSISSTQSSSHDPSYQTLSELDDGYSERTTSSYGTTGSSAANEVPQYSDPSITVDTAAHEHVANVQPDERVSEESKIYYSTYKYHVPNKVHGTLPRDKKKAAVIGKAVAKGRNNTLKKASVGKSGEDNCSASTTRGGSTLKSSSNNSLDHLDDEFSDFESDCDFTDSEWETDGEEGDNLSVDNQTEKEVVEGSVRLVSHGDNNNDSDDSDYDTCIPVEDDRIFQANSQARSRSKFYTGEADDLVSVMRHSTKKEKDKQKKKRLKTLKQEFKSKASVQKLMQSSNSKLAAVKTFFAGKLKKPVTPRTDIGADSGQEVAAPRASLDASNITHVSASSLSNDEQQRNSDAHSDISNHSSGQFIPRPRPSPRTNHKAYSAGAAEIPPPLPPRNTTRSQCFLDDPDLGQLPAPPPPLRTTSKGQGLGDVGNDNPDSSVSQDKPLPAPRSPKSAADRRSTTPRLSTVVSENSPTLDISLHKACSSPVLSSGSPEGAAATPHIPLRKESSKSLVTSSSDDESVKRRNEILTSAAKANGAKRQNSFPLTTPAIDEEPVNVEGGILRVAVPAASKPRITESSRTCSQIMVEDEPLYQDYHQVKISSVRQKSISKTSTLMKSGQPSVSLWSTTHDVLESGVIDHMNAEEIKLQEAMFEVITSEASYLRSIKMLNKLFVNSEQFCSEEILPVRDKKALFSNISAVLNVSTRLFTELEAHWKNNVILTAVCELISKYAHSEFDVYITYCSNQAFQDRTLKRLLSENIKFQEALSTLEKSSECQGLTMSSFLLLPMQRITRLPLLLDAILRRQEVWSDQYRNAQKCYELVKKVVSKCNEGARKMEQREQVINIENTLLFTKLKKIPLASASRLLIKKGDLVYLSVDGGRSTVNILSIKPKNISLFLFNDMLLITKKKGEHYVVIDHASRVHVQIEDWCTDKVTDPRVNAMAQKSSAKFMFMLVLLENHQKKHGEYLLSCHTETERTRWTDAFTPQVHGDSDDKIYETWDCPQVSVSHSYVAQQPDELNLEAGDVINVLRKTPDGWYEGERVSDGRTGWLPSSYTVELQNEHVRARHLKERNKLLQAAAKMNNKAMRTAK